MCCCSGRPTEHRSRPEPLLPSGQGAAARVPLLRDRRLYRLCVLYMASFGVAVVLGNWVVTLLERAGGYSNATAGLVGSLILGAGIVSRPLGGWVARRHPTGSGP